MSYRSALGEEGVGMRRIALGLWVGTAVAVVVATAVRAQDTPPPAQGPSAQEDALERARKRGKLLWGADLEGGAPFVFANPEEPEKIIGFEVDIANELGKELGIPVEHHQLQWVSIYDDVRRGAVDFGMNGLEVTEQTRQMGDFTRPYYIFSEQLVVRATEANIQGLSDLAGREAGTLEGTLAERMLTEAGATVHAYGGQIEPYEDLELGRVDAVLLDLPITKYYAHPRQRPSLRWVGPPVGRGQYAIVCQPGQDRLRAALDAALATMTRDGRLATILRRWDLWDEKQWSLVKPDETGDLRGLFDTARIDATGEQAIAAAPVSEPSRSWLARHGPLLLGAAVMTVWISIASMAIAIGLGVPLAVARVYSGPAFKAIAGVYVEIFRGTPVMLQLFVIYYGMPHIGIELPPLAAAVLGLGLNYAAYEAEIYRAGLQAVPKGQFEAALALGMTRSQAIRRILLPQAMRIVIPPVTNDFVALLKDTSIVSVIAIQELTKRFYILGRSDVSHFVHLAAATALLYLLMSYPLSLWARRMERRLAGETR
jgi:polar amino acid transport system substrate-binding protein